MAFLDLDQQHPRTIQIIRLLEVPIKCNVSQVWIGPGLERDEKRNERRRKKMMGLRIVGILAWVTTSAEEPPGSLDEVDPFFWVDQNHRQISKQAI